MIPDHMTSKFQPNQVHSAIVDRSIPIRIIPDVVSSSEPVSCCIPITVWETRLQELTIYKQHNKHTNVPQHCPSNKLLGQWVQRQRIQYKLLQEEKKSAMTDERIKSLNELDFEWMYGNADWDTHLQELATYKEANLHVKASTRAMVNSTLHTNVPQRWPSNKLLGQWVKNQRYQYKLLKEEKKSAMTDEPIKSLNELDFTWSRGKPNTGLMKKG
jgi:hypothetical protein